MNFTILIIGAVVLTSFIAMLTIDMMDDHNEQKRSDKLETQLETSTQSIEKLEDEIATLRNEIDVIGIFVLWGTIYTNKDYLQNLMETYDLL